MPDVKILKWLVAGVAVLIIGGAVPAGATGNISQVNRQIVSEAKTSYGLKANHAICWSTGPATFSCWVSGPNHFRAVAIGSVKNGHATATFS